MYMGDLEMEEIAVEIVDSKAVRKRLQAAVDREAPWLFSTQGDAIHRVVRVFDHPNQLDLLMVYCDVWRREHPGKQLTAFTKDVWFNREELDAVGWARECIHRRLETLNAAPWRESGLYENDSICRVPQQADGAFDRC